MKTRSYHLSCLVLCLAVVIPAAPAEDGPAARDPAPGTTD